MVATSSKLVCKVEKEITVASGVGATQERHSKDFLFRRSRAGLRVAPVSGLVVSVSAELKVSVPP
jgi:hypothetical protein